MGGVWDGKFFSCGVVEVEAMHSLPPPTCAYSLASLYTHAGSCG